MHPKVFISHASEDKARFVLDFAGRLRGRGIDAWLDRWEMLPGDSLVDKIFEEGIRNASAVIVVISEHSIVKPWVRDELNAAFVKRISTGSKLIPVVLDSCEVPVALSSTVWERISDLSSYDDSFDRIVAAVTGSRDKPPLGELPAYVTSPIREIPGLTRIDNLILKSACEMAMAQGHDLVEGSGLLAVPVLAGVSEKELEDSLEVLERDNIVKVSRHLGPGLPHFRVTIFGFQQYAKVHIDEYEAKLQEVALAIVNLNLRDNQAIAARLDLNQFLADHALDVLEHQGYVRLTRSLGGHTWILDVSATLRRALS